MRRGARRVWNRLLGSLFGGSRDAEMAEELEAHVQLMADAEVSRGVPPEEALRRARMRFGGMESAKESCREQRGLPFLDELGQDLRYAVRAILRSPGFAAVAVLSLAVGIGANTAIFSMVNAVLLRPLAYTDPDRLYFAREMLPHLFGKQRLAVNPMHALEWAKVCPSVEQVAVIRGDGGDLASGGEPMPVRGADVTHNFFRMLGAAPVLGRGFLAEEEAEGSGRVVILSESLWQARFHGDRGIVGRAVLIDGERHLVVGVLPESFRLPFSVQAAAHFDILRPLVLTQRERGRLMGNFNYSAVVRLKRGATLEQAVAEMDVVQARFPERAGSRVELKAALVPLHEQISGRARQGLWMLAAAVGAVLLIVCVNLANLLLSRMAARRREAAIRTALGASRGRQLRMVLTESLVLALAGGALGVALAAVGMRMLAASASLDLPRIEDAGLDGGVLAFAFLATVGTGLAFGTLPGLWLTRRDPQQALRAGSHTTTEGRGGLRMREALITLEVGLSAALLIAAGLLMGSMDRLLRVDKGFQSANLLTVDLATSGSLYTADGNREKYFERLLGRVQGIAGVQSAGMITNLPTRGQNWEDPIYLMGDGQRPAERHPVNNRYASPGYFGTIGVQIRRGRGFSESDRGRGVAVLSEQAAQLLWPADADPVGRMFMGEDDTPKTLVGIAAEVRADLHRDAPPMAYYPYWQRVPDAMTLVVRTAGDPRGSMGAVREAIRAEDPQLPVRTVRTMEEELDRSVAERRFQALLMGVFAAAGLLVASLGIYGVVAFAVARRRNEIGIRMALGAPRSRVLGLVARQGMTPVVIGLALGVGAALAGGRALRGLLFAMQPTDVPTIAGVAGVLLAVGLLACLIPARRVLGIDAVSALRSE